MKKMLEDYRDLAKDELKKLLKKGDLAATDWDAAKKAFCVMKDVLEIEQMLGVEPGGYSEGYHGNNIRYGTEYSGNNMRYGTEYSGYNRSPVTGRFISHNYTNGGRYSGHSMKDRMIARLETMYDESNNDYERQAITNLISRVEAEF